MATKRYLFSLPVSLKRDICRTRGKRRSLYICIATQYMLGGWDSNSGEGRDISYSSRPAPRPNQPSAFSKMGTGSINQGRVAAAWRWSSAPPRAKLKEGLQLRMRHPRYVFQYLKYVKLNSVTQLFILWNIYQNNTEEMMATTCFGFHFLIYFIYMKLNSVTQLFIL